MIQTILLSKCCNKPVKVERGCDRDLGHMGGVCTCGNVATVFWVCEACKKACDIAEPTNTDKE